MPLAPEAQAVLDLIARANRPPYHELPPAEARREYKRARRALQPPPPEVASVEDRRAPGPHGEIPIRLYRPLGSRPGEALPALVFFHGGGHVIGDLDTHDVPCRELANASRGAVVAVDYRLAPEHAFPHAVDDAFAATRWVAEQAGPLGLDRARLAVGGDSAGGNLAAVVALLARDAGGPRLAFQLLVYPGTTFVVEHPSRRELGEGYLLTRRLMTWFTDHYLRPEQRADWRCSPLEARDHARLPPALVITCEYDPLRDEGAAYAERLRAAGVTATLRCVPGMIHGFITMGRAIPAAGEVLREAGRALAEAYGRP